MSDSDSEGSFESADEGEGCTAQAPRDTTVPHTLTSDSKKGIAAAQEPKDGKAGEPTHKEETPGDPPRLTDNSASVQSSRMPEEQKTLQHGTLKHDISGQLNNLALEQSLENNSISVASHRNADDESSVGRQVNNVQQSDSVKEPARHILRLERKVQHKDQRVAQEPSPDENPATASEQYRDAPPKEPLPSSSSWGWGSWGSSLLSTATSSVATFTSHVSSGIGTVFETVEATLGAPSPEELAEDLDKKRKDVEARLQGDKDMAEDKFGTKQPHLPEDETAMTSSGSDGRIGGLFSGVSTLSRVLESTSSRVISGGLDTLEMIGRKTFDLLTEGDPGLRNKRSFLSGGQVSLSQVLREAKEQAEAADSSDHGDSQDIVHFSKVFDNFQGLTHLEALEMLSSQSRVSLKSRTMALEQLEAAALQDTCDELRKICEDVPPGDELGEVEQDFLKAVDDTASSLPVKVNAENLKSVQEKCLVWLKAVSEAQQKPSPKEIHCQGVAYLAELTARAMEFFHRVGELLLIESENKVDPHVCAIGLTEVSRVLCAEVNGMSAQFSQLILTSSSDPACPELENEELSTDLYLEASNSTTYIQDGLFLLIPVLQLRAAEFP